MMNRISAMFGSTKAQVYAVLGALLAGTFGLMIPQSTRHLGVMFAGGMLPITATLCYYLYHLHASRTDAAAIDTGLHPSKGLFVEVPQTWTKALMHGALYAAVVAATASVLFGHVEGAEDAGDLVGSAAMLIGMVLLWLGELMAMVMVSRWGTTPSPNVQLGFIAAFAALCLGLGVPASALAIRYLESRHVVDAWGLMYLAPGLAAIVASAVWFRGVYVSRWKLVLAEQANRAEQAEMGRKLAESQLAMLQAQIEPHFLYNTLASVQYLVRKDADAADFLLTQLIRYLRHAMPKLRHPMSTLGQEFELADAYLQIVRMRMGGRLSVELELPERLHGVVFPPLVLQTLVENAVKHGVEPKTGQVRIVVTGSQVDGETVVQVSDNGVGLRSAPATAGSGTGLANIRDRLQGIYGDRAQLSITSNSDGGVTSIVAIETSTP